MPTNIVSSSSTSTTITVTMDALPDGGTKGASNVTSPPADSTTSDGKSSSKSTVTV